MADTNEFHNYIRILFKNRVSNVVFLYFWLNSIKRREESFYRKYLHFMILRRAFLFSSYAQYGFIKHNSSGAYIFQFEFLHTSSAFKPCTIHRKPQYLKLSCLSFRIQMCKHVFSKDFKDLPISFFSSLRSGL